MNNAPYHVTIYLFPAYTDSGSYHAEYNVRMTGLELIEFNRSVDEIRETIEAQFKAAQQRHQDRLKQLQREGKSTREAGFGPMRPEFKVHVIQLEESVIDGDKLLKELEYFAVSEGLREISPRK